MKTIRKHFEGFPEPYRTQALANLQPGKAGAPMRDAQLALAVGFIWVDTPEGMYYWMNYYRTLKPDLLEKRDPGIRERLDEEIG